MYVNPEPNGGQTMHRLAIRVLALTALLTLAAGVVWASSDQRKGTSGATELLIPVGPRGTSLSGTGSTDAAGVEAMFWNPAGVASLEGTEALFSHTTYIADMKVNFVGAATKVGGFGTIGVSAKVLSVGDIPVTTETAPDGTGEIISPTFTTLGLTWARQFTDRVRFGSTFNVINEHILDNTANGFAVDFGVQYDTGWRGLRFGIVMKNFGPSMEFRGPGFDQSVQVPGTDPSSANRVLTFSSAPFELPSYFTFGTTYDLYRYGPNRLHVLGLFQSNNFSGDNFAVGAEWNYRELYSLRGSWYGTLASTVDPITGDETSKFTTGDELYSGYALGAGLAIPTGGSRLGVDVTWKPVKQYFDDVVELGLRFTF